MKMNVKIILQLSILTGLCTTPASAIPGGTYVLTGKEKSIKEIVKADMEKYPYLYKGESPGDYLAAFRSLNKIGTRTLVPGDELVFPETMAMRSIRQAEIDAAAEREEDLLKERHKGIYQYQQEFLPTWMLSIGEMAFSAFESGIPPRLIRRATDFVDVDFAESMQLKSYPEKKLYIIIFEQPERSSQCYLAAFALTDEGFRFYTLEKGITLFDTGADSVLWVMGPDGERIMLGYRSYTNLSGFLNEQGL